MANEVDPIPTTVDYTNRDYYSLRSALIERVKARIPEWVGADPSDFALALIESFAYMGDVMSYYIDRVANELSLSTANQRQSILNLARMYGYNPSGYQSATCTVTFTNSSTSQDITLPAGTQLSGQYVSGETLVDVIFEIDSETVIAKNGGQASVGAYHGENIALRYPEESGIAGELIGSGATNGAPNQSFRLLSNQVVDGSVRVFVKRNNTFEEWTYIQELTDAGPTDAVFTTYLDADNFVYVIFGDAASGRIPTPYSEIKAQYIIGGGAKGRIPEMYNGKPTLTSIYRIPGVNNVSAISSVISISNSVGIGGLDPEDTSTIRRAAPFALTALNRAVTTLDYAYLTLNSTLVGKANATANSFTSVTVYVAPAVENDPNNSYPLYDQTAYYSWYVGGDGIPPQNGAPPLNVTPFNTTDLYSAAVNEINGKTQIGVTYTVSPPLYAPVKLEIKYTKLEQYTDSQVKAGIQTMLETKYGYINMDFAQTLYREEIEYWLQEVPGVKNVNVVSMYRAGSTPGVGSMVGADNEIFVINPYNADMTVISAAQSGSTINTVALSDVSGLTFNGTTYTYTGLTSSSATTTLTLTKTDNPNTSVLITMKNPSNAVVSTSVKTDSTDIILPLATGASGNTLTLVSTSEDKLSSSTYTFTIVRS